MTDGTVAVWDLGVRLFHWLLVLAVLGAAWTGLLGSKQTLDIHLVCGALIGAALLWRLVWGGLGSTYARFRSFVVRPSALPGHIGDLLAGRAPAHVGHNPLGGAMIVLLLAVLALLVATGLVVLGGAVKEGPLAPFVGYRTGLLVRRVHELAAYGLLGLVLAHVAGVLIESRRTAESLIRAMLSGRKPARPDALAATPVAARTGLALLAAAGLVAAAAAATVHFSLLPALGVPAFPLDAAYAKECGACHTPHHPSLAPAATWARLVATLDDHFGDNASLDAPLAAGIGTWLAANAAERWDTPAANLMRQPSATEPLRITATAGWRQAHRVVAPAMFEAKAVGGRLNCANCHRDAATGRFRPRAISVPDDATTNRGAAL